MATQGTALITGASSGIGRAFAERLATDGYGIVLVARRKERLDELAAGLAAKGAKAEVLAANLAHHDGMRAVEARIGKGDVSMLVNNAGFAAYGPFVEQSAEAADEQIALHCTALVRLTRAALPAMIARGAGAVVNVSSSLAYAATVRIQRPKRATYAATKAFINMFTQILAQELEGSGVKVQALCPGLVRTEFHNSVGGRPEGIPVAEPADIVRASLAGLAIGEVVCVPTLSDAEAVARANEAEKAVFTTQARSNEIAGRYLDATA